MEFLNPFPFKGHFPIPTREEVPSIDDQRERGTNSQTKAESALATGVSAIHAVGAASTRMHASINERCGCGLPRCETAKHKNAPAGQGSLRFRVLRLPSPSSGGPREHCGTLTAPSGQQVYQTSSLVHSDLVDCFLCVVVCRFEQSQDSNEIITPAKPYPRPHTRPIR